MQKITPFLWYDGKAEEAAAFYVSLFKDSKITSVSRYGKGSPAPEGSAMSVNFQLEGQDYIAFNGGPHFQFTPAFSMFINCKDQAEVDGLWDKLLEGGGKPERCGWLKDKFGLSWQVIPSELGTLLGDKDPERAKRAMQAMMQMVKIDIQGMKDAADGK